MYAKSVEEITIEFLFSRTCALRPSRSSHLKRHGFTSRALPLANTRFVCDVERRGWAAEYWAGQVIQCINDFDSVVGSTVKQEVELQLDKMVAMGVNTITVELRTTAGGSGPFVPPTCPIPSVLGFQWPQPTAMELTNLPAFFDLVHSKGMRILLRLVNTHMEEQPPTNSQTWLGAIHQ